jgi:hypothetical protein
VRRFPPRSRPGSSASPRTAALWSSPQRLRPTPASSSSAATRPPRALTLLGCYTQSATAPCSPGLAAAASDLAVTPDGRTLVGVSELPSTLAFGPGRLDVVRLDPESGALASAGCFSTDGHGCARLELPAGAASLAVAPDGRTLYVGGQSSLRAYRLAGDGVRPVPGTGGCVTLRRRAGCALLPEPGSLQFDSLAVSPDGDWLYAAGGRGAAFRIAS